MIGISTKDNNSSDDNSVSSVDDIEGDFTYTATPTSIIDDLSIPGAFAQHLQCSNKRCNDTECSAKVNNKVYHFESSIILRPQLPSASY